MKANQRRKFRIIYILCIYCVKMDAKNPVSRKFCLVFASTRSVSQSYKVCIPIKNYLANRLYQYWKIFLVERLPYLGVPFLNQS